MSDNSIKNKRVNKYSREKLVDKRSKSYKKQQKESDYWQRYVEYLQGNPVATLGKEWKTFQKFRQLEGKIGQTKSSIQYLEFLVSDAYLKVYRKWKQNSKKNDPNFDINSHMKLLVLGNKIKLEKKRMKLDILKGLYDNRMLERSRSYSTELKRKQIRDIESGKLDIYDERVSGDVANEVLARKKRKEQSKK